MAASRWSSLSAAAAVVLLAMTTILLLAAAPSALAQAPAPAPGPSSSSTIPCPAILDKITHGIGLINPAELSQIQGALGSLGSLRAAQCVCYVVLKSSSSSSNIGHGIGSGIGGAGDPTAQVVALLQTFGAKAAPKGFTCS